MNRLLRPWSLPIAAGLLLAGGLGPSPSTLAQDVTLVPPSPPAVLVGLERLEVEGGRPLRGRKVGLLANASSTTADGRQAPEVLQSLGVEVVKLFAAEHGFRFETPPGEPVPDEADPVTNLPVVSLFGTHSRPSAGDLQGLDALVVDLQDSGVRFDSFTGTVLRCLDAAAEVGLEVVVLDRPNPLGDRPAGPFVERSADAGAGAPGPLLHGLTLGELARQANSSRTRKARLRVVGLGGWSRGMTWVDTGRPWVPPSPALRSPEAVVAFGAVGLLQATNVSEGRGTDTPFLLLGAPWLRAPEAAALVSATGFSVEPARFTPRSSFLEPAPRYRDTECRGLRVRVRDPRQARPYDLGVSLLWALRRQPEFEWRPGALELLLGTPSLREALRRGDTVADVLQRDTAGAARWRQEREKALLY